MSTTPPLATLLAIAHRLLRSQPHKVSQATTTSYRAVPWPRRGQLDEQKAPTLFQAGKRLMIDFFSLLRAKALLRYLHHYTDGAQEKPDRRNVKGPPKKAG